MASYDVNTYDNFLSNISKEGLIAAIIITLAMMIFFVIVTWKIYKKMGAPGWASLVPIYNIVVLLKKVKLSLIYLLLLIIPIVNIFAIIKLFHSLSKAFGKGVKYTIFTIIFPYLSLPILAFGNAVYIYENEEKEDEQPAENIDTEYVYCPKCNTRLAQNADSCFICGYKIKNENNANTQIENEAPIVNNIENNNTNESVRTQKTTVEPINRGVDSSNVESINNQFVTNNINPSTVNSNGFESNQEIIKNYNIPDDVPSNSSIVDTMVNNVSNESDSLYQNVNNVSSESDNLYQNINNDINNNTYNNEIDAMNTNLDLNIQDNLANNNAPSIEEMFNFDYNNITEANNLVNSINNNQSFGYNNVNIDYANSINNTQVSYDNNQNTDYINTNPVFDNYNMNIEYNNAYSNQNYINNGNITGGNNFEIFNNQDIVVNDNYNLNNINYNTTINYNDDEQMAQNTEVLDLDFQETLRAEDNTEVQNTEILNFPADNLKVNCINVEQINKQDVVNNNQDNINLNSANIVNGLESVVNNKVEIPAHAEQINQDNNSFNNNVHVSPIKKTDGYRVCPICGSKVLPNATNCVICGSKV